MNDDSAVPRFFLSIHSVEQTNVCKPQLHFVCTVSLSQHKYITDSVVAP